VDLISFGNELKQKKSPELLLDFARKYVLHGIPYVFQTREDDYYEFRKRIANKFNIPFHQVYIAGSAKLGFSPLKMKQFDLDSDIDVALISAELFESFMRQIALYQMQYRRARFSIHENELKMYHEFLEYVAIGWFRPDKLPISFQMNVVKNDWFDFFKSISYKQSEVGDYKVTAGVFKSYEYFESYTVDGLEKVRNLNLVEKQQCQHK
jgi:hypothetical protein